MTYRDIKIYIMIEYIKLSKFLCREIEMTSLKHMSWMEILSTGVCIAIIIADTPCNSMINLHT